MSDYDDDVDPFDVDLDTDEAELPVRVITCRRPQAVTARIIDRGCVTPEPPKPKRHVTKRRLLLGAVLGGLLLRASREQRVAVAKVAVAVVAVCAAMAVTVVALIVLLGVSEPPGSTGPVPVYPAPVPACDWATLC